MRFREGLRFTGACVLLGVLLTGEAQSQQPGTSAPNTFSATASADVARFNVAVPNYLLIEDFVDGGGPSAQAVLDSLGTSRAFASFPYPGETGVAATGLVSTLTGRSLPPYPFIANSSFPSQPEYGIDQPGYHLHAASDEKTSSAQATLGETTSSETLEGAAIALASTAVDEAGRVVAHAEARGGLELGAVTIRGLHAIADIVRAPDGSIDRSSSLTIASLDVSGIEISVTPRGLGVAGTTLVPAEVVGGLTDALSVGDTDLELVPESSTEDSVTSAALRITTTQMLDAIDRPVIVTYTIGGLFAAANGAAFPLRVAAPALPAPSVPLPGSTGGSVVPPAFNSASASAPPAAAPAAVPAGVARATARRVGVPLEVSGWTFFPVLALAGAAVLAGALASRSQTRGGTPWSS